MKNLDEADEARRQLKLLPKVLRCDHFLELRLEDQSQLEDLLEECDVKGGMVIFQDKKSLKVGISCGQSLDLEGPTSLVMGPDPSSVLQATRFRKLWGESNCQVRRFQDGSLRETVPIEGPFRLINGDSVAEKADHAMDASDFVLHRWIHLIRIHCQPKEVRVARPLNNLPDLLKECYARAGQTRALRAKTQDFINLLTGLSSDAMPVRRAKARCGCMYGGHAPKRHLADASVPQVQGELKEKSTCIPPRVYPIPVDIEITSKSFLRPDLYTRLSLYHLRQLSSALASQGAPGGALCGDTLVVPYKQTLYGVKVQEAKLAQEAQINLVALHEILQGIGTRHPCWWGALTLMQHWIKSKYLSEDFDELAADILMGVVFCSASGVVQAKSGSKLIAPDAPPASADSAFLRFLYTLSFADFATTLFFLNREDCSIDLAAARRHSIGWAVAVVTPWDDKTPGVHMAGLDVNQLKRIVNTARRTLFECLKGSDFEPSFETAFAAASDGYDFQIQLKPFKSDPKTMTKQINRSGQDMPVMDFDAVDMFLDELRACYGAHTTFHYSEVEHAIGVRMEDKTEIDAVIEDAKILGKGIVSQVCVDDVVTM